MSLNNICPDCKKVYDRQPVRCICGWYLVQEDVTKLDKAKCHYIVNGVQCNDPGMVAISARSKDWFCSLHATKLRDESYIR